MRQRKMTTTLPAKEERAREGLLVLQLWGPETRGREEEMIRWNYMLQLGWLWVVEAVSGCGLLQL